MRCLDSNLLAYDFSWPSGGVQPRLHDGIAQKVAPPALSSKGTTRWIFLGTGIGCGRQLLLLLPRLQATGGASPTAPTAPRLWTQTISIRFLSPERKGGVERKIAFLQVDVEQARADCMVLFCFSVFFCVVPPVQNFCTSKFKAWDLTPWCSLRALHTRAS